LNIDSECLLVNGIKPICVKTRGAERKIKRNQIIFATSKERRKPKNSIKYEWLYERIIKNKIKCNSRNIAVCTSQEDYDTDFLYEFKKFLQSSRNFNLELFISSLSFYIKNLPLKYFNEMTLSLVFYENIRILNEFEDIGIIIFG